MSASRRRLYLVAALCSSLAVLAGCGGGGSTHVAPLAPMFTSTPPPAAEQDTAYSYSIAATDPSGGTVSFALTSAPTGAVLSGSSVAWTPPASQSRLANSFTVTATTSEGGTATQSWSVSPTGTITVNTTDTFWTSTGPQPFPAQFPLGAALVPNTDGSLTVTQGSFTAPGVFSIPGVPAGYYWLATGLNLTNIFDAIWTSSSTVDFGRDLPGPQEALTTMQNTTFNFNLSGLDATSTPSLVAIYPDPGILLTPAAGATTESASVTVDSPLDWSKIDTVFLMQYEPMSLGTLNNLVLGPALTLSDPGFTNGGTNTITGALVPSAQSSVNINVPGSQWAPLFGSIGPSAAVVIGSSLSVSAEPFITGRNQSPDPFIANLPLVMPVPVPGISSSPGLPPNFCLGSGGALPTPVLASQPAVLTDQNFGALEYGDAFPSSWTRAIAFCQVAGVPIPIVGAPGTSLPFPMPFGVAVPPSGAPSLAPLAGPVQNPTMNGASLFTQSTINTTAVTLSWSTPPGATPFGYRIAVLIQTAIPHGVQYAAAGDFTTAKNSVNLPPLTAGNTYVFIITTAVDAAAIVETSPNRSALPTGFANIVSAPITVSSGAKAGVIRGDTKAYAELTCRKGKTAVTSFFSPLLPPK